MKSFTRLSLCTSFMLLSVSMILSGATALSAAPCPSKVKLQEALKKTFHQSIKVVNVSPSAMSGLCQIQVRFRKQNRIVYTDPKGEFLIAGQLFEVRGPRNLTRDALMEINRLTKEDFNKLDELVAFTIGKKGPTVYFVTDPQCPYCKKAENIINPLAKHGKVQVKYLLFPLKFHKGSKEECISIICDRKGLEGFKNRYRSENQCEAGKKKIHKTLSFLMGKGITGTPTYIFPDGRYHSGVMNKKNLEARLSQFK